eukprot:gene6787-7553_t
MTLDGGNDQDVFLIEDDNFSTFSGTPSLEQQHLFINLDEDIKTGIYFEYEGDGETSSMDYQKFQDQQSTIQNWKHVRPNKLISLAKSFACSFPTTLICGTLGGLIAVILAWLDINLAESCYSYNTRWYEMPINVRRIRLTAQVAEGMIIQSWSFSAVLFVFGWKRVHELNLPIWNMFAAALDAIYRLFLSVYGVYNRKWASYPLNALFATITCFNFYRVTSHFERKTFLRVKLAVKFGIAFVFGIPILLMMNYFFLPLYSRTKSDITKAVFSSLLPVAFIIPKAVTNVFLINVFEFAKPGRFSVVSVGFHTITSIVARYLQANVETTAIFIALCFVHAIENLLDKLTVNFRNKCYRYFCGSCVGRDDNGNDMKLAAMNRMQAEQTIAGMILETDTIVMSCALVEILNYYYGNDIDTNNKHKLFMRFLQRISIATSVDLVFNTICIHVQTWYFNIPVMRVWKKKWLWIIGFIITYTCYTVLWCSEYLYGAVITHNSFNSTYTAQCLKPFEKPHG